NRIQPGFDTAPLVLPQRAEPGDIVVNEMLFNPTTTGVDFVEVFNRSAKAIDLRGWSVRNAISAAAKNVTVLSENHLLMRAGEFKVFTEDPVTLKGEYLAAKEETFWQTTLPPFNDDMGSVALLDADGQMIDSIQYSEGMHTP